MLDDSKTFFFLCQVRACLPLRCITSSFNNTKCFQTEETNCCSFESEMFFPAIGWWLLSCALIISRMLPLLFCQQDTSSMVSKRIFTFWMVRPRDCRRFALHLWVQQRTVFTDNGFWTVPEPCSDFHIRIVLVFTAAPPDRYLVLAIGPYIQRFLQILYIFNGTVDDEITNKLAILHWELIYFWIDYIFEIFFILENSWTFFIYSGFIYIVFIDFF